MDLNLKQKQAMVCGSTQGIGKAIALELAQMGASVTLVARNEEKLKDTLTELDQSVGQQHDYICADFSDQDDLATKIQGYIATKPAVHILINNTGGPAGGPILEAQPDEFKQAFSNHLICNHILVQAVAPLMKQAGYGRIINIISTSVKQPLPGLGVSNTIRGAVANWAKTLSLELAPFGITVNNVLPGATVTGRHTSLIEARAQKTGQSIAQIEADLLAGIPAGRFAAPAEVAAAAAFLASPAAGYINGINVPVDGGRTGNL
ncbi:MAG: 3-oxoacyl-[acyl-carrier protein] reductase [uncultured Adhaeribacter sp.]|uniref:3-oxoacyl-[acyl-carrier protein] reductase n=1 Tax=uncultured Adhaeribacter sp. TaxID=448109 RepID=A0A6J4H3H3_9BACT|nr:MAG: 3-oxoacyl-[acyl-carrier protein] reductase [uncultured Adhaeribacter sp.]